MEIREYNDLSILREETDFGGVMCPVFILDHMRKILENPGKGIAVKLDDERFRILDGGQDVSWTVRFARVGFSYYGIISASLFGQPVRRVIGLSQQIVDQWVDRLDKQE